MILYFFVGEPHLIICGIKFHFLGQYICSFFFVFFGVCFFGVCVFLVCVFFWCVFFLTVNLFNIYITSEKYEFINWKIWHHTIEKLNTNIVIIIDIVQKHCLLIRCNWISRFQSYTSFWHNDVYTCSFNIIKTNQKFWVTLISLSCN